MKAKCPACNADNRYPTCPTCEASSFLPPPYPQDSDSQKLWATYRAFVNPTGSYWYLVLALVAWAITAIPAVSYACLSARPERMPAYMVAALQFIAALCVITAYMAWKKRQEKKWHRLFLRSHRIPPTDKPFMEEQEFIRYLKRLR
jgi:hypothetical protein